MAENLANHENLFSDYVIADQALDSNKFISFFGSFTKLVLLALPS